MARTVSKCWMLSNPEDYPLTVLLLRMCGQQIRYPLISPPLEEFKAKMDQRIWELYHIEVEHLCAINKDGSKRTYEQMFYHVPIRRSQSLNVERERTSSSSAPSSASRICGTPGVRLGSSGILAHRVQGNVTGFPPSGVRYNWCQKLKLCNLGQNQRISPQHRGYLVPAPQIQGCPALFS